MFRNIALFLFLLVPSVSYAQLDSQFTFIGQNAEVLKTEKKITIVTPETIQVPSTCTRQIPVGTIQVCRNETRYREECSWIPSSERCWNDTDRVCHPVTRTRQECSRTPSRQVCTERPSREVCTERPTREVCNTRPDGRQHCTTVGGGTHCTTVGGGESCHEVPGEDVCRNVSYTDQDCEDVTRRLCETVPGRNDCHEVPYSERVCEMETEYRTESYACTKPQVINRTTEKTIKSEVNVQIITNGLVEEFPVAVSIKETSSEYKAFNIDVKLLGTPKVFVVLNKKDVKMAGMTDSEILLKSIVVLEVLSEEMLPMTFPTAIVEATIEKSSQKLTIIFEGGISAQGSVDLLVTRNGIFGTTKKIAELKEEYPSKKIELGQIENKGTLNIDLNDSVVSELKKKNMRLKLSLHSSLNLQGELLNANKPITGKSYDEIFVGLK